MTEWKTCHLCFVDKNYLLPILKQKRDNAGILLEEWEETYICLPCLREELV